MSEFNKTDPSKFLSDIIGSSVVVKLHNGVEYLGNLQSIDGFMNVVLDDGKESINGQVTKSYGDVFIRGNNVLYISEA
ncbi:LSM6 [[Candida] subhashii]|uniref:LSM6 n=1 Tax=[Candida] subhashii TaxID=561895 RepID=A0A8J5QB61_9ASCO|nr:LSM6 [[Candida] subhashii]KAG7662046.1 LSM6 [[Candida] subhashii]